MIKKHKSRETMIKQIESLIKKIEYDINIKDDVEYSNGDLTTVVSNLNSLLENYKNGKYNNRDIMVNVVLMKGMMLINLTNNNNLNYELNKLRRSLSEHFLKEIENNQYEIDGSLIANNHVELIRNVMPGVFSILHNHIELLNILSTHKLNSYDKDNIKIASKFLKKFMSTFIQRFKNFGKTNTKEETDLKEITELLEKLDTGKTDKERTEDLRKMISADQENTREPQELLATDQENTQEPPGILATEKAIAAVLNLSGKNDVQNWKDNTVFKLQNVQSNKSSEYYMNLLTHNADVAYLLVGQFEQHFLDEIDYIRFHNGGNDVFFL